MKINIDYLRHGENPELSNQALTYDYIKYAVVKAYPDGLRGQKLRLWGAIQRKLEEGMKKELDEIELQDTELYFVHEVVDKCSYEPHLAKFVILLQDELEKQIENDRHQTSNPK